MGLDIRISRAEPIYCPHCGELVTYKPMESIDSGGRQWYKFLEYAKYYKPYLIEQDMYGEDMTLSKEQISELIKFIDGNPELYMAQDIYRMVETARVHDDAIVINADW